MKDIVEIRPGKISFALSGSEDGRLTLIASGACVTLPVPTILLRDKFLRRFQAFLEVVPVSLQTEYQLKCGIL